MKESYQAYLDQYLASLPNTKSKPKRIVAEYFCADEYNANECARLVLEGKKRATCSLKVGYDVENEALPSVGDLKIVLNWQEQPVCIIETTDVQFEAFNEVTKEFAEAEGEGDGTYEWWRKAHIDFFTSYSKSIGVDFNENSELVLERFQKVFPVTD